MYPKHTKTLLPMVICLFLPVPSTLFSGIELTDLLPNPSEYLLWKESSPIQKAKGEDLYLLIDGGAELYLEYGFEEALMVEYAAADNNRINIEIYRMKDSESAYGIYSLKKSRSAKRLAIGGEAARDDYYMNIWAGEYVITLTGLQQNKEIDRGLDALAERIAAKIVSPSRLPNLVKNIRPLLDHNDDLAYFKGPLGFRNRFAFPINPLPGMLTGIVSQSSDSEFTVIVFSDSAKAETALQLIIETMRSRSDSRILGEPIRPPIVVKHRKNRFLIDRTGSHLLLVSSPDQPGEKLLLDRLKATLSSQGTPPLID